MSFRVTDSSASRTLTQRVAAARARVDRAQERIATGKRINRPSDDPAGAAQLARLRAQQSAVEGFSRMAGASEDVLLAGDSALDRYELVLDQARTLMSQGATDTATPEAREAIAAQLDGLRERIAGVANMRHGDRYIFGGTQQAAAPFDETAGAFTAEALDAAEPTARVEPDTPPVLTGVTAAATFADEDGSVFDALASAAAALRDTTDPAASNAALRSAMQRVDGFAGRSSLARARIGSSLERIETANERLNSDRTLLAQAVDRVEAADLAESIVESQTAGSALEAVLRTSSQANRRSLIDFLG